MDTDQTDATQTVDDTTTATAEADAADTSATTGTDDSATDDLGDAGKKALRAEREARKAAEKKAADALAKVKEYEDAQKTELERAIERAEQAEKAKVAASERVLHSEVKVAAAGRLADPVDAIRFIDLSQFTPDANGDYDSEAISAAVDELVRVKPYLAADSGTRFKGTADGGARSAGAQPTIDDQIATAQAAGDAMAVIRLNNQKLAAIKPPS